MVSGISFCPEHGWRVRVDEDGCCSRCGADAVGVAIDRIVKLIDSAMSVATFERRIIRLARGEYSPDEAGRVALELLAEYRRLLGVIGTEREEGR